MSCVNLLVITIERRSISVAAFSGLRLDYIQTRQLSSDFDRARVAAKRFVSWAIRALCPDRLLLELPSESDGRRRTELRDAIRYRLAEHSGPRMCVEQGAARRALGIPELRTRGEVLEVARNLWPQHGRSDPALYAAATGLCQQMLELFINDKSTAS